MLLEWLLPDERDKEGEGEGGLVPRIGPLHVEGSLLLLLEGTSSPLVGLLSVKKVSVFGGALLDEGLLDAKRSLLLLIGLLSLCEEGSWLPLLKRTVCIKGLLDRLELEGPLCDIS